MSERTVSTSDPDYTPYDRVEERSQWLPGLLSVFVATAGMGLQSGLTGLAAGAVLVGVWARFRIEFAFATGLLLFVALGGSFDAVASIVSMAGLVGLLAVDVARAWDSMRPVVVFLCLFVIGSVTIVYASGEIALHWLGLGGALSIATVSYGLHRYDLVRFEFDDDREADREPDGSRSDDSPDRRNPHSSGASATSTEHERTDDETRT